MVGEFPETGAFPAKSVVHSKSVEDLFRSAKWARRALLGGARSSGEAEVSRSLWEGAC